MASELIKQISDASFEANVLKPAPPCWWTTGPSGAAPAKMIAPILDERRPATYQGKLTCRQDERAMKTAKFLPSSVSAASPR